MIYKNNECFSIFPLYQQGEICFVKTNREIKNPLRQRVMIWDHRSVYYLSILLFKKALLIFTKKIFSTFIMFVIDIFVNKRGQLFHGKNV